MKVNIVYYFAHQIYKQGRQTLMFSQTITDPNVQDIMGSGASMQWCYKICKEETTEKKSKYIYLRHVVKNGKKVIFFVLPCRFIFKQTCLKRRQHGK